MIDVMLCKAGARQCVTTKMKIFFSFIMLHTLVFILVYLSMYEEATPPRYPESIHNVDLSKLTILVMNPEYGLIEEMKQLPKKCGSCVISHNIRRASLNNTKALVFHFNDPIFRLAPRQRRLDQHYVWYTGEGPVAIYHLRNMKLREFDGFFNLTMSYRRDSDVWCPYGTTYSLWSQHKNLTRNATELDHFVRNKTRMALWVVSNCEVMPHARERKSFVMELIDNGLRVDLGGGCFNNKKDDFENHKYKFYLAFENQWNCKDYITEKFWDNALKHGTVPVVLGPPKKDYELVAPSPNSFIYAADFNSTKDLADYLNYLDKNDTAYKEYLSWMKSVPKFQGREKLTGFCKLCRILHENKNNTNTEKPRIVSSLYNWFYGREYSDCLKVPQMETESNSGFFFKYFWKKNVG